MLCHVMRRNQGRLVDLKSRMGIELKHIRNSKKILFEMICGKENVERSSYELIGDGETQKMREDQKDSTI